MIKTTRMHYEDKKETLEDRLNFIVNHGGKLMFITSEYYGNGEVGYTIIYETED